MLSSTDEMVDAAVTAARVVVKVEENHDGIIIVVVSGGEVAGIVVES